MIHIKVLKKHSFKDAQKYWNLLEKKVDNVPLVCTWEWVATWIEHFGDIVDYTFFVGFDGDKVVGITLITKEATRWLPVPVNAYHLGTQGEPLRDWIHMVNNNILALDSYYGEYIQALTAVVMDTFNWEELLIEDANPVFAEEFKKSLRKYNIPTREVIETCHIVNLDRIRKSNKTVLEYLSADTRYQIKRNLKEFQELDVEYAETLPQAISILDELIVLQKESFQKKGRRSPFASSRFTKFQYAILKKRFSKGNIILFRVRSKRLGTVGCFSLYNDNKTAFGYLCGLRDYSTLEINTINPKRLKPGFVMHALCMQECLERGINEYNFSIGNEPYKKEFTSETKKLVTLKLQKSLKAKVRESLFETYIKIEEQRKFNAVLKPFYAVYVLLNR